jgi:hypothetical protein
MRLNCAWLLPVIAEPIYTAIKVARVVVITVLVTKAPRVFRLRLRHDILGTAPHYAQRREREQKQRKADQPTHKPPPRFSKRR